MTTLKGAPFARRRRSVKVFIAIASISTASLIAATGAHANGLHSWLCGVDNPWEGVSSTSNGAETSDSDGDCGTDGVRVEYRTYPTSPLYTTGWYYGNPTVIYNPHSITEGGVHKVASCGIGYGYTCGPQYT